MTVTSPSAREQRASARGQATIIQAGGNVITGSVFVGSFARLRDRWLDPASIFRDAQVESFTGRQWLVDQIDRFIATKDHGHVIVQADAGLGKTALAAWLAWKRDWPCHFTRLSNGHVGLIALSNLGAQLIARYGLGEDFAPQGVLGDTAGEAGWFQHVLQAAAGVARASGERVVIVVDGLDEAEPVRGALPLGLPVLLPPGVFIVATCRTGTNLPALRQPCKVVEINAGSRRNSDDLAQYLRAALATDGELVTVLADAGQAPDAVAARLLARCGGVWIYLRYVLNELRAGERSVDDIDSLPGDLFAFYAESLLVGHHDPDWGKVRLPLLATLAVAPEPLPVPVLTRLAGLPEEHPVQLLCGGRLLPFLTVTPPHGDGFLRYSVYHASLREFLVGTAPVPATGGRAQAEEFARAAVAAHSRIADTYLDAFGGLRQGLPALAADPSVGQRDGGYALRHLTGHLERAGRDADLTALLAQELPPPAFGSVWYVAHEQAGTLAEYRSDLDRARRLAADRTDRDLRLGRLAPSLALELRYLMIDSAIRASVPIELITRLVKTGLWTTARGLFYARQPADLAIRAMRLALLLPALPEEEQPAVVQEAMALASQVASPYWRARTCSVLADYFPKKAADEAATYGLAATAEVEADDERAQLLAWLAGQLPVALLPDATSLAHEIRDEDERVRAFLALVPLLSESALPDMVAALTGITRGSLRESLITAVASRKPVAMAGDLAAAARTLHAEDRAWALRAVANMMPVPDLALVAEALAAAQEATSPVERADALLGLFSLIDVGQREQMLDEALSDASSADDQTRFAATILIAQSLPAPRQRGVIRGLLRDVLDRPAGPDRTRYLASLASSLTEAQVARVIRVVLVTESEEDKAGLLAAYAPFLPDKLLPDALQAAAALSDEATRGSVIEELAPKLPEPLLAKALSVVGGISDTGARGSCVASLAGRLPEGLLGQALGMVQSSASESGAARFLLGLAQRCDGPRRTELLREALASARAATDGFLRAQALGELAASLAAGEQDGVLAEAGEAAEGYPGDYRAAYALDYLIRRAAGGRRRELIDAAFARTRAMSDTWWRPAWLASLARYVPKPERPALLTEALADARSLPSVRDRIYALGDIAMGFPGDERIGAYHEFLALAGDGEGLDGGTARAMIPIARTLPDRLLLRGLELLRRMRCEDTRLPPVGWLLKLVPDRKMDEALAILRNYPFGLYQGHAFGTVALYMPERIRPQVLRLALDAAERVTARRAILAQARLLWPDRLTQVELEVLRQVVADNALDDYLSILAEALDIIVRVAGTQCLDDCLDAFRTVQCWWPPFTAPETPDQPIVD